MACLTNYILVKGHCEGATPTSNLYINVNLPGITLEKAANTAEGALQTGVALLNQSISNGISRTRQDLIGAMLPLVRFNQLVSGGDYGEFTDTYLASYASANRGVKATLDTCCRLGMMNIPRVRVLVNNSGSQTLTITDGVATTAYAFTSVAGVPQYVETRYKSVTDTLYLTLSANLSVNDSLLDRSGCGFCTTSCDHCSDCKCSYGLTVTGWDGANETGQTYGIIPTIQVQCDAEKFFCEISHLEMVQWAALYAAGIDFLEFNLLTNRVNEYTIYNDHEEVRGVIADWEAKRKEKMDVLSKTLPIYLNSIDSCCIDCNASTWEYSLP